VALSIAGVSARDAREARVPTDEAIDEAVKMVRDGFKPGDQVRVVPSWSESIWHKLAWGKGGLPTKALHRGDKLDPIELLQASRVWVIATFDRPAVVDFEHLTFKEVENTAVGSDTGVTVALYTHERPWKRLAQLSKSMRQTKMAYAKPGEKTKPCRLRGTSQACGKGQTVHVKRDNVHHREVEWALLVPGADGWTARMEWPLKAVAPRGPKAPKDAPPVTDYHVVVRAGLTLPSTRKPGETTFGKVFVDDKAVGSFSLGPQEYSLARFHAPARPSSTVRIELSAATSKSRWVMVETDVLVGPPPEALEGWFAQP